MSQATAPAPAPAVCAPEDLPLDQRPERPNPEIEEKAGKGPCKLVYKYPAEKTDQTKWFFDDTQDGRVYIRFEVWRQGADRMAYLHKSRPFCNSLNIRENLRCKKEGSPIKNGFKVDLIKQVDFKLADFFVPPSPPSSLSGAV